MSSRSALTSHSAPPREERAGPAAGAQSKVSVETAANDDESTSGFSLYGDPLFGMAIATGILFALLAAFGALG
ncbi:MAG TPA: hypothetical protein VFX89_17100 [Gammaproteobacteria bacterium]|nr:hypothetical protein [Gammaproteobacteria bacterium]